MRNAPYVGIGILFLTVLPNPTHAQEAYYMAVLSAQSPDNVPRYSHTFATFLKTRGSADHRPLESFTISWLPRTTAVRLIALLPEPGRNFDLSSSLRLAYAEGELVSMWGPYQIQPELYLRALNQKARLEGGAVSYKALDSAWPCSRVSNCIHAVSDLDKSGAPLRIASPGWGDPASYYVTLYLLRWTIDPCQVHEWVVDVMGLRNCCIRRRDLREGNPAESRALRAFMAIGQHRLEKQAQTSPRP